MRKIQEVLRLKWSQGLSNRQIAKACAIARLIVDLMPADDSLHARDLEGLQEVQEAWAVISAYRTPSVASASTSPRCRAVSAGASRYVACSSKPPTSPRV